VENVESANSKGVGESEKSTSVFCIGLPLMVKRRAKITVLSGSVTPPWLEELKLGSNHEKVNTPGLGAPKLLIFNPGKPKDSTCTKATSEVSNRMVPCMESRWENSVVLTGTETWVP